MDRVRAINAARINSALKGARSTEATRADQDAFVRGEIDIAESGIGCVAGTASPDSGRV